MSDMQEAIFSQGTKVGELAQDLFPGGKDASPKVYWDFSDAIEKTSKWIEQGVEAIYEAAFQFEGVLAALDIFVQKKGKIYAYEVKSSTEVKEVYLQDAALQYYVMEQSGHKPDDIFIVYVNREYKREQELDLKQLFSIQSVLSEVLALQPKIPKLLKKAKATLKEKEIPEVKIGKHCNKPYDCDFMGHCWKHIPDNSVFDLRYARDKKWTLYNKGILSMKDIPKETKLSKFQTVQVRGLQENYTQIDHAKINKFLKSWKYPLYFLDFETFNFAVPRYTYSRPYQQIPFQYSLHILEDPEADLDHSEFLADPSAPDPRIDFAQSLIAQINQKGSIIVYNKHFEEGRLREIQEDLPEFQAALEPIKKRMIDLMKPFQKLWYYEPKFNGSYSIKRVLPTLVPELSYDDLDVSQGDQASRAFAAMVEGEASFQWEEMRKNLLAYCKMDTMAMVEIWKALQKKLK